jgi:hypothetical protein
MTGGGLSKSRLARMHDVMGDHVARGEMPGLVTLICRRDEVHVDAIGMQAFVRRALRRTPSDAPRRNRAVAAARSCIGARGAN